MHGLYFYNESECKVIVNIHVFGFF